MQKGARLGEASAADGQWQGPATRCRPGAAGSDSGPDGGWHGCACGRVLPARARWRNPGPGREPRDAHRVCRSAATPTGGCRNRRPPCRGDTPAASGMGRFWRRVRPPLSPAGPDLPLRGRRCGDADRGRLPRVGRRAAAVLSEIARPGCAGMGPVHHCSPLHRRAPAGRRRGRALLAARPHHASAAARARAAFGTGSSSGRSGLHSRSSRGGLPA